MRYYLLLGLFACGACFNPTAPKAEKPYCPFILATHDSIYIVNGVPLRVIDTVRRCF